MLEPITLNSIPNCTQDPLPPLEIDSEVEYIVEAILDSNISHSRTCLLQYFVKWEGYNGIPQETSWTDVSLCKNAPDLIEVFHQHYPDKPGPLAKPQKPLFPPVLLCILIFSCTLSARLLSLLLFFAFHPLFQFTPFFPNHFTF